MNIIELINLIKPRPELFIHEHDIFCLYSFLNGWYYRNQEEDVKANILYNDFYYWLRKKYHLRDTRGWASILFYKFKTKEKALDAFFELFDTFYQEHISRDFLGKVEWLIITLEDETYDEIAHLLKEDLKCTTSETALYMKLQSHLNTILQKRSKYPRTHFSLVEELLEELNEKMTP